MGHFNKTPKDKIKNNSNKANKKTSVPTTMAAIATALLLFSSVATMAFAQAQPPQNTAPVLRVPTSPIQFGATGLSTSSVNTYTSVSLGSHVSASDVEDGVLTSAVTCINPQTGAPTPLSGQFGIPNPTSQSSSGVGRNTVVSCTVTDNGIKDENGNTISGSPITVTRAFTVTIIAYGNEVDDRIDNDGTRVVNTIDSTVETATITAGRSVQVGFRIVPAYDDENDPNSSTRCGASDSTAGATITRFTIQRSGVTSTAVTAGPSSLTFTTCNTDQYVTFSTTASTPTGTYTISIDEDDISDSNGDDYNTSPATFTLSVTAAPSTTSTTSGQDQVANDIDASIDTTLEAATIEAGASKNVGYFVNARFDTTDDQLWAGTTDSGSPCNAADGSPVTITIGVPQGVTASKNKLTFIACGTSNVQPVTFSSMVPGTYNIPVTTYADFDRNDGYILSTATFTLTVQDTTAPQISITKPTADTITRDQTYNIEGTVSDAVGVSKVEVFSAGSLLGQATINNGAFTYTLSDEGLYNQLTVRATDAAGNTRVTDTLPSVTIDRTSPTVAITSPAAATITRDQTYNIAGTVSDTYGVASVEVFDDGASLGVATVDGGTFSFGLTAERLYDKITVRATDTAGNTADTDTLPSVTIDRTSPTVAITSPAAGNLATQTVSIQGTTDANSQVKVYAGAQLLGPATVTGTTWTFAANLPLGESSLTAVATDAAGNEGTSPAVVVNVVLPPPSTPKVFSGLLQPINSDGTTSAFKLGSTIPVKFKITENGLPVQGCVACKLQVAKISSTGTVGAYENEVTSTSGADTGNTFRYDATGKQYIYNLATNSLPDVKSAGSYPREFSLQVLFDDGTASTPVKIAIRK